MIQLVLKNSKIVAVHEMHQDIRGLYPGCDVVTHDRPLPTDEEGGWLPNDPRTNEEKEQEYADKRRLAYPTIEDQLDMIYNDTVNGTATWADVITAIKEQFPKPVATLK